MCAQWRNLRFEPWGSELVKGGPKFVPLELCRPQLKQAVAYAEILKRRGANASESYVANISLSASFTGGGLGAEPPAARQILAFSAKNSLLVIIFDLFY